MRQPMDLIPVACGTYERSIATIAAILLAITNEISARGESVLDTRHNQLWGILGNKFKHEDFLSEDERKKERADSFCVTQERPSALFLTVHRNDKFTQNDLPRVAPLG